MWTEGGSSIWHERPLTCVYDKVSGPLRQVPPGPGTLDVLHCFNQEGAVGRTALTHLGGEKRCVWGGRWGGSEGRLRLAFFRQCASGAGFR